MASDQPHGDYTVVVSNALGSVTSSKATLTVSAAPVTTPTTPASGSGSSGGGGTISAWFVFAMLALRAVRGGITTGKVFQTKRSWNTSQSRNCPCDLHRPLFHRVIRNHPGGGERQSRLR